MSKKQNWYQSNMTQNRFDWYSSSTGEIINDEIVYCIDPTHYIAHANWETCEVCNGIINKGELPDLEIKTPPRQG